MVYRNYQINLGAQIVINLIVTLICFSFSVDSAIVLYAKGDMMLGILETENKFIANR